MALREIRDSIAAGAVSSKTIVNDILGRIAEANPRCQAYTDIFEISALEDAKRADRAKAKGVSLGPLHGVPIAVKDLVDVSGTVTGCGSPRLVNNVAASDSFIVRKLRDAGAVLLGKLAMTEFALGGYHPVCQVPENPWRQNHWAGVSSSGSAVAVAENIAPATIASDTGGSIRIPAAVNGVVGIKPTRGLVSKRGVYPLSPFLDHVGTMAATVEDAALLLSAIMGHDDQDPFSRPTSFNDPCMLIDRNIDRLKVGIDWSYIDDAADKAVSAGVERTCGALSDLGIEIVDVDLRATGEVAKYWGAVVAMQAMEMHRDHFEVDPGSYGPVFRGLLESSNRVSGKVINRALEATARACQAFESVFTSVETIIYPSCPFTAFSTERYPATEPLPTEWAERLVHFAAPMNFAGLPAVCVPAGFSDDKLPVGVQLVGDQGSEATLVQIAHHLEQRIGRHPSLT